MNRLLLLTSLVLYSAAAAAQRDFSSLEEQMTGKEFTAAGLQKLSADELQALNEWLRAHSVGTLDVARAPQGGDTRGFEDTALASMDGSDIVAHIDGPFSGWDGNTVFKLDNGMVWKQTEDRTFYLPTVENPLVRIEKGMFGVWKLSVEGYNRATKVERIE